MRVYLSGNITGLSFKEANSWRLKAANFLSTKGIEAFNPLDHQNVITTATGEIINPTSQSYKEQIYEEDLKALENTDVLVVNLNDYFVGLGTGFEFGYAIAKNIPVIVIASNEFIHHPFLLAASYVTDSLMIGLVWITDNLYKEGL